MKKNFTEIVAKALSNDMIKLNPSSYTYTGGNIIPEFYVTDGAFVLYEGKDGDKTSEYEVVSVTNNLNVGTGKLLLKVSMITIPELHPQNLALQLLTQQM